MMEFYTENIRRAKKSHKCDLCGNQISIGEKYHRQSGKYDGEFFDRCLHERCNNIISTYCKENNEQEYDEWSIEDWLSDSYCYCCEQKEDCETNILECNTILKEFKVMQL